MQVRSIAPMIRRRLSPAGKLAVGSATELLKKHGMQMTQLVFASRCGEIPRCLKLIHSIFAGEELSPTDFSASVHNANAGICSIVNHFQGEVSAVTAGEHTFEAALTEAYITLSANQDSLVLVVCFEEDLLRQNLMTFPPECDFHGPYALALLLGWPREETSDLRRIKLTEQSKLDAFTYAQRYLQ